MVTWDLNPARTALLIVDLQNLFVEGHAPISAPAGLLVLERMNQLAATCRDLGMPIIYTAHVLRPDLSNIGQLAEMFPVMRDEGLISVGSEVAAIHPGYVVGPDDIYLEKPRFGSFTGTDLELILRTKGVDTVVIGGIATNVCVETTAREANHREFKVVFLSDGTTSGEYADVGWGTLTPDEVQKATLTIMAYAFAEVASCDDVAKRLMSAAVEP
ncbi:MAG: Nicotinamidase [Ilumatobacteraceae bacterium]|nr:Nicotinamidase [Ilumatobacteraceae bacterium]